MKHTRHDVDADLDRLLGHHKMPDERMQVAIDRVRERLRTSSETPRTDQLPERHPSRYAWRAVVAAVAMAGMIVAVTAPWQTEWLATVEAADGSHYKLGPNTVINSSDPHGAILTLKDGSRVEMRAQSALSLERTSDGIGIRLRTGDLVVNAARQDRAHLYVHTNDMTIVDGTMFVVNAEGDGSRVAVIDGDVHVRAGTIEKHLTRGEQVATSPALASRSVTKEFTWSRQANVIAAAFAHGMADTAAPLAAVAASPQAASGAVAAQPASPEFEAASIRECDPDHLPEAPDGARGGGANSLQITRGRLRALCVTVATLIRTAYGYLPMELEFLARGDRPQLREPIFGNVAGLGMEDGRRVRGGPDWIRSEHYTIEAVAADGQTPSAPMMRGPMLQRLLERRFQFKGHVDVEQTPTFALTVAKGGLKIRPVTGVADACEPMPSPTSTERRRRLADIRRGEKPNCAFMGEREGPNMVFVGGAATLNTLASFLGGQLGGMRVLDRTGLTDKFNYVLEFAIDENAPGAGGRDPATPADPPDVARAPTIFTALEDQLGLRLERAQVGREFVVVDHIERLTPN
jgi:uncharacterized protein (TIGR03435 family)